MAARITVFLVPTRSIDSYSQGIDLVKLARYLNRSLSSFRNRRVLDFKVVTEHRIERSAGKQKDYSRAGLDLRPRWRFRHFNLANQITVTEDQLEEYKQTCLVDLDAFEQIKEFVLSAAEEKEIELGQIIGIGSEVVSEDREGAQWKGKSKEDAYSCIRDVMTFPEYDNDFYRPSWNVTFISLARAWSTSIFGQQLDRGEPYGLANRAIISRYIISNLSGCIAASVFKTPLSDRHIQLCVASDAWGDEEAQSYAASGLCGSCQAVARTSGLAARYKQVFRTPQAAFRVVEQLAVASKKIEADVAFKETYDKFINIVAIAILSAAFVGLIVTYESNDKLRIYDNLKTYSAKHWPAVALCVVGFLSCAIARLILWIRTTRVP